MGEFETLNFSIGIVPEDIALFHALYRTSIKGRRDLVSLMFGDSGVKKIDNSYTSRVAEIFNVILKSLGIGLEFVDEDERIKVLNDDYITEHHMNGQTYFCTEYQFFIMERIEEVKRDILTDNPVLTESQLQKMIEEEMKKRSYINGPLNEDLGDLEEKVLEEIAEIVAKQKEEREKKEAEEKETATEDEAAEEVSIDEV